MSCLASNVYKILMLVLDISYYGMVYSRWKPHVYVPGWKWITSQVAAVVLMASGILIGHGF